MTDLGPTTVVRRSDTQVSTELDEEAVALHTGRNAFFTMNPVATRVWQLVEQPASLQSVFDALVSEFDVDQATCEAEVTALLDVLVEKELVVVVSD